MNKRETVVVLGASYGQLGLINECRKYGCEIIVVSPIGNYPGMVIADEIIYEDVRNVASIYEQVKNKNVKAILHDQLDVAVISAAHLSAMLGIKGVPITIAKRFTDKSLMRKFAKESGIAIPKSIVVREKSEIKSAIESLRYPLIMKPIDSSASHGVYRVENYEDILSHYEFTGSFSTSNAVIIEEYIEGQEYVVEAFTREYQTSNLIIGKRSYFNIPNTFIPNRTIFKDAGIPANAVEKSLNKANIDLITSMGLEYGMTHAEFIYNSVQNKVYLVEIAARGGGVRTSTDIVPAACGVNMTKLYVDAALGYSPKEIKLQSGYAAYLCFLLPEGEIVNISGCDKLKDIDGVVSSQINLSVTNKTLPITDKYARQGPIIVKGNSEQECFAICEKIQSVLRIDVKTQNGIEGIIWE